MVPKRWTVTALLLGPQWTGSRKGYGWRAKAGK